MSEHRQVIDIASDQLHAQIDPLGAQLHTLRDQDGRDLQWDGDPAVWTGRAPILFPIVGMLVDGQYRLNGKTYPMGKHGFARHKLFNLVHADHPSATFRLGSDADTLVSYPFQFELDLHFAVSLSTLTVKATIRNLGDTDMPASFGFHPAFRWPLPFDQPRSEHFIRFAETEPAPVRRMDHEGLLKPEGQPTPVVGDSLKLQDCLFVADALMFDQIKSRSVRYGASTGQAIIIDFPDTPYLGLWTKPGADFIAIEPWHGINDAEDFKGNIWQKPGIFCVLPGSERQISISITLQNKVD